MSDFAFPTLDSLRDERPPERPASTEWVGRLGSQAAPAAKVSGWRPQSLADATKTEPSLDLEALKAAAQEEGFRAGYAQGHAAGAEIGLAEGHLQGRDEGQAEIFAEEAARLNAFRTALEGVVAAVGPAVGAWQAELEARVTELAMGAVRALLAAELATKTPDAMGIVREALGHATGAVRATIRLAPFDRAGLEGRKEEIFAACAGLRDVELVDDRSISGGCVVETEQGIVDATLATRLTLLEAA